MSGPTGNGASCIRGDDSPPGGSHAPWPEKVSPPPKKTLPNWAEIQKTLWYDGRRVKWYRRPAKNKIALLRAFEAAAWQRRIADPLPPEDGIESKARLHDTIKKLNRGQRILHFGGDGTGAGVVWMPYEEFEENRERP
jgi:hypothetical protein